MLSDQCAASKTKKSTTAVSVHFHSKINTNKDQELVLVTSFDKSSSTFEPCPVINVQPVRPKNPTMLSTIQCDALVADVPATLNSHDKLVSFFTFYIRIKVHHVLQVLPLVNKKGTILSWESSVAGSASHCIVDSIVGFFGLTSFTLIILSYNNNLPRSYVTINYSRFTFRCKNYLHKISNQLTS